MTASTSGTGPRSKARESAIEARRRQFDEYVHRMLTDPMPGTTWHPLFRWPSDSDEEYAARVAEHERNTQTTGHAAGER
ncbi:hypothetical protein [Gordonia sp. 852002-50395_SCH5434458]|uniref:hypothetical protein n=1 Tax=Gordonia sp. 852002-50395_SCH5434458 TaxID=1834090 RepID=UPI0007EA7E1C|nr:hypothetical protein [Gordonia sp. 852002-50395_SCH5434458]OBC00501.1 hypothetical protein A5785_19060 [Gordonia sp. 852002-50395_SCH5434458]